MLRFSFSVAYRPLLLTSPGPAILTTIADVALARLDLLGLGGVTPLHAAGVDSAGRMFSYT